MMEPAIMQRQNERRRVTVAGRRTDDGALCTLLLVHEIGDTWACYPHGAAQLGVRLGKPEAVTMARAILGEGA